MAILQSNPRKHLLFLLLLLCLVAKASIIWVCHNLLNSLFGVHLSTETCEVYMYVCGCLCTLLLTAWQWTPLYAYRLCWDTPSQLFQESYEEGQAVNLPICEASQWVIWGAGFSPAVSLTDSLCNFEQVPLSLWVSVFPSVKGRVEGLGDPDGLSIFRVFVGLQVTQGEGPCLFYSLLLPEC